MYRLDGSITSQLDWAKELSEADGAKNPLVWHLDMQLFSSLKRGLTHSGDFQALVLALEHFKTVVWPRFGERTAKVILFQGSLDMRSLFPWDSIQEENFNKWIQGHSLSEKLLRQYCLTACAEYLNLLVQKMPDEIPLTLQFEASSIGDPFEKAQLLNPEQFPRFNLEVLGGEPWTLSSFGDAALCLPLTQKSAPAVRALSEQCRLIPESALVYSWDRLERLYYDPAAISQVGKRKLQGFCAAGGTIIPLV